MFCRKLSPALVVACLLTCADGAASADEDATLLRVFLSDGTSLVSYGELARVGDRVVFSMPMSGAPNPPLHLVNIAASRVDWTRTNRYAASARAAHYAATQADLDFAALSNQISQALFETTHATDNARRLAIVEQARKTLAEWPQNHFNYRQADVRQMLSMLDEAIADLRAAAGVQRFDLSLSAFVDPPADAEPLLPRPMLKEAIEQVLLATRLVDTGAERRALLGAAVGILDRDAGDLPPQWVATTRADAKMRFEAEVGLDRSYQTLAARMLGQADSRARAADVRGLLRLVDDIHQRNRELGDTRPEAVNALLAAVDARLDAARRLQLARDRWTLRVHVFNEYWSAIKGSADRLAGLTPLLEDIKSLAGSSPVSLTAIQRIAGQLTGDVAAVVPPQELRAAHAAFASAVQLAGRAALIRREAALAVSMTRAWDASSAAAGALMLSARAREDIQTMLRPPQLQ